MNSLVNKVMPPRGQLMPRLDRSLVMVAGLLIAIGIMVVSSASTEVAQAQYGSPFYHLLRHMVYLTLALSLAGLCFFVPIGVWEKSGWLLLVLAMLLLVLVLVPGIGREVNGSMRWIRVGPVNLQASELAKLFMVIYLAGYLVRRLQEVRSQWSGFIKPMSVLFLAIVLLLLEPDFGAVVVLMSAALGMMFLGGVRLVQFLVLISGSLVAMALVAVSQPYRMQRLITFVDPWAEENVFASGYQLTQALIAFGRGEWLGVGLGNSVQKLFYLPEAHTDFVFAIWAEEMGLLGSVIVIALYLVLVVRCMSIGHRAEYAGKFFAAYLCYGIALLFGAQALINIGVNTGLLPTKGLTLPLLSYGGSSLIACCISLAIVLRVDYESQQVSPNKAGSKEKRRA